MRRTLALAVVLVAACTRGPAAPSAAPTAGSLSTPSAVPTPSPVTSPPVETMPAPTPSAIVLPTLPGVVEVRPEGWFHLNGGPVEGYPDTFATAYGPDGEDQPIEEGPSRLVLYEAFSGGDAYFRHRVDQAKSNGAHTVAVEVNGAAATAWVTDSTGELLLGWQLPGKFEVLVGNRADFTVKSLVKSAESVSDCCG